MRRRFPCRNDRHKALHLTANTVHAPGPFANFATPWTAEVGRSPSYRLLRLLGSACDQAICNAAFKSALLSFDSVPVVAPRAPQAFATGAKACGSSVHLKSCSLGVNMKFAVLPSAASVT